MEKNELESAALSMDELEHLKSMKIMGRNKIQGKQHVGVGKWRNELCKL